jgi:hypothetical protein
MELTFEQESFISDVQYERQYEDRILRELDSQEEEGRILGFHRSRNGIEPIYDETKQLDEIYADIPEDDLYEECNNG